MEGDPSNDQYWMPSDSSNESGDDSGPLEWPPLKKSKAWLVGHAQYLLEKSQGEPRSYKAETALQLQMAREAYIKRADSALHSLLSGSHAGEDELNKARELIKGQAAKYALQCQLFSDAISQA